MTREEASQRIQTLRLKVEEPTDTSLGWLETWIHKEDVEALKMAIKALERLPKLQNRCFALTQGQMCFFCPYECEHRAAVEPQESEGT